MIVEVPFAVADLLVGSLELEIRHQGLVEGDRAVHVDAAHRHGVGGGEQLALNGEDLGRALPPRLREIEDLKAPQIAEIAFQTVVHGHVVVAVHDGVGVVPGDHAVVDLGGHGIEVVVVVAGDVHVEAVGDLHPLVVQRVVDDFAVHFVGVDVLLRVVPRGREDREGLAAEVLFGQTVGDERLVLVFRGFRVGHVGRGGCVRGSVGAGGGLFGAPRRHESGGREEQGEKQAEDFSGHDEIPSLQKSETVGNSNSSFHYNRFFPRPQHEESFLNKKVTTGGFSSPRGSGKTRSRRKNR